MLHQRGRAGVSKGLGLLSGGLDSILACLVLRRAGVEVAAVSFSSPFFGAGKARAAASAHGIPLTVLEVGPEHLEQVVKRPRYGYGSNMNPCLDCHAYMFRQAGRLMEEQGHDFLFSGEVLGQRPMSQNKQALATVAKFSGFGPRILRPLSALVMEPTAMEQAGLVERERLLGLSGRGRKPQMDLARDLGVRDYPAPAGGCLLTEPGFSRRLKDLLAHDPGAGVEMVELLKHGRHLRLSPAAKLIVGRNQAENQALEAILPATALSLVAQGVAGPLGLYFGPTEGEDLELAAALVAGYGQAAPGQEVGVQAGPGRRLMVTPLPRRLAQGYLL
ncbi:MAG: tRNA 4-thiouridine(8) synthase ThiI [Desulfarculus sp.]|nr:tRNA 4-thiouridine(8) synthase ThiI [Desulfarculus sp.]